MSSQYENKRKWGPPNYDPGFTIEDWMALLKDETIFTPDGMEVINCVKDFGGVATCVELSKAYGKTPNHYNNNAWRLGERIHKRTGCPLCHEKDCKYWPILFLGRHVSRQRLGNYEWKLRDELSTAMDILASDTQSNEAKTMPLSLLEETAKQYESQHPHAREITVRQVYRNPYIKEYARRRANGICQLCGLKAPFCDLDGNPYLESHHIIWLSQGGQDALNNVVALCPNCHRKMHIVQDQTDIEKLKQTALSLNSKPNS